MSIPTQSELNLVRTRPHQTKHWLSVFRPTTALACLVNDVTINKGSYIIPYDTVSVGSYTNIRADYVMLVGTSAGASDIGRIRVRSATSSTITVAENSDIAWADNLFLTVLKYVDITPIFPRIIQDPANAENVIFYKDYDIPYTNQNTVLGTLPCATNHKAGFRDPASSIYQAYWTATGSFTVTGEAVNYSWEFEGGSPSSYIGMTPGYVQYNTAGHYETILTITGANVNDVVHRYVSVYDRPEAGNSRPDIIKWELEERSGSRGEGGYSVKIKAYDASDFISADSLIVIFSDDWYGNTQQSIGGNAPNNSTIKFVGYVVDGTISYNWRESYVEFEAVSPTGVMALKEGFSVSCESKKNPNTWFEIKDMSITRAIYHYLRWHSTVLKVCDFEYTGDDTKVQYFDADRENLRDSISKFLEGGIRGELVCDKQGKIWAEVSAGATPSQETAFPIALTMQKMDWMDEPNIDERLQKEYSYLEYGGIAYSGVNTGTFAAFMSGAPGRAPSYSGKVDRQQGLILTSQSQLNQLVGNMFAYKNSRFPDIEFVMSGNYANLDIAPIERVQVNMAQTDTARGITLTNSPFHISRISWEYDEQKQVDVPTVNLAQLVNGVAGTRIPIPPVPPSQGYTNPNITIPPIPSLTFPPFDISGLNLGIKGFRMFGFGYNANPGPDASEIDWYTSAGLGASSGNICTFPFGGYYTRIGLSLGLYLVHAHIVWTSVVSDLANGKGIYLTAVGSVGYYSFEPADYSFSVSPVNQVHCNVTSILSVFGSPASFYFSVGTADLPSTINDGELALIKLM